MDFLSSTHAEEHTFDEAVTDVSEDWPGYWRDYWGLDASHAPGSMDPDLWSDVVRLDRDARRLVTAAAAMSNRRLPEDRRRLPERLSEESEPERETWQRIFDVLKEHSESQPVRDIVWSRLDWESKQSPAILRERFFRTAVQIYAFEQFGHAPESIAERLLALLDFLVRTESQRTQRYLERVARCFILDLRAEMAVMSRAVMEAALQALDLESVLENTLNAPDPERASLSHWIEAATSAGILDEDGRIAADKLREAGNDAVHVSPELIPDPPQLLGHLALVLEQIGRAG